MGAEQSSAGEYFKGEKINEDWSQWMRGIPNSTSLADISIPGTHDSMAFYGGAMVQCQSMSLYNQYVAGIRFVDIRCRHFENGFPIHHGSVYQHANFDDVLKVTQDFLRRNSTETVLMSIKEEHTSENNTRTFTDTFNSYLSRYPSSLFYKVKGKGIPNLGDVRGKIYFLSRFSSKDYIDFDKQDVKDDYEVATILPASIDPKLEGIYNHIEKARQSSNRDKFYITFCSGVSSGAYPDAVANRVNIHVRRHAEKYQGNGCLGIVILDFPGSWVSHAIFMTNPRATP